MTISRISLVALFAAGVFALYTAPSFAQQNPAGVPNPPCTFSCSGGTPTDPGGDPNGGPDDGPPDEPGQPYDNPFDEPEDDDEPGDDDQPEDGDEPGDDDEPGDNDDGGSGISKTAAAELKACLAYLGRLPNVTAADVSGLADPSRVMLKPVCNTRELAQSGPLLIQGGNAYGLEDHLKANALVRSKLGETVYKPRDVVGIDFDVDGNAILYVHKVG